MIEPDNSVGLAAIVPTLALGGLWFVINKINNKFNLNLSENKRLAILWIVCILFWTSVIVIVKCL